MKSSTKKSVSNPIPCRSSIALAVAKGKKSKAEQKKSDNADNYREKYPP